MSLRILITTKGLQTSDQWTLRPSLQLDPVDGHTRAAVAAVGDLTRPSPDAWVFVLPDDTPRWGFSVTWGRHGEQWAHSALPPDGNGPWDGWTLPLDPLPAVLDYGPALPTIRQLAPAGDHFIHADDGSRWWWRGLTSFRLLELVLGGADITERLHQAVDLGANLVRVLSMKTNNTGWSLDPYQTDYWGAVEALFRQTRAAGLYTEFTVFADTRAVMSEQGAQLDHWAHVCARASMDSAGVLLELLNEQHHPTQSLDPMVFSLPSTLTLCSHGSGLTDSDVVRPLWHYATYHARRMQHGADARGFTNYSPYAFQEGWPKPCPFVADEGEKPPTYGFSPEYARLMGLSARCGAGGTFHWGGGVGSDLLPEAEAACARAFYSELLP